MNHMPVTLLIAITKSNWGGAQRYVYDIATHFHKDTHFRVIVATGGDGDLITKLEHEGIPTRPLSSLKRDVNFFDDFSALLQLFHILRKEKPDILHLNSSKIGLFGALVGRLVGVKKIVFTAHAWPFNETRPAYQRFIFRVLGIVTVLLSHQTIAVSQSVIKSLRAPFFIARKMRCVYTGIDTPKLFEKGSFFKDISPASYNGKQLVSIGELHTSKGLDRALIALAQCTHLPWTYHIIGSGEKERYLKNLASQLGISNRVIFHGFVANASLYLNSFDVFLFPSRTEALGYVAIEALFSNLPIIASNAGGIPEVLFDDPYTKLIDCNDGKAFKETLLSILKKQPVVDVHKRPGILRFLPKFMFTATKKIYLS
ncbi:MAG: hypothetical protein RLZZ308_378 [Candidatus Parcubacteria bacterium]|jgi:glycosyltransferase involved in cell wall biosynthesis